MLTDAEKKANLVLRIIATGFGFLNTVGCIALLIITRRILKTDDYLYGDQFDIEVQSFALFLSIFSLAGQIFGFIGIIVQNIILLKIHTYIVCGLIGFTMVRAFWYPMLWSFFVWFFVHGLVITTYYTHLKELRKKYGCSSPAAVDSASTNSAARNKI